MGRPAKVKPDMPGHAPALLEGLEAASPGTLAQRVQTLQEAIQTLAAYLVDKDQLKASAGDKALVKIAEGMP